jgi:phage tail-like protein
MALSKEEIKAAYPLPVYNYRVEIAGQAVAFSEVSGLNITYETTTYKESPVESGAPGPRVMHMPAQGTPPTITLNKGLVRGTSVATFYSWINAIQINQVEKKDIYIRLCDENGDPVISWKVTNAFPTTLNAPSFDANSNDVAIESMELMGDRVSIEEV